MKVGCESQLVNNIEKPLTEQDIKQLGCRPDDRMDSAYVAENTEPAKFSHAGKEYLSGLQRHRGIPSPPGGMHPSYTVMTSDHGSG